MSFENNNSDNRSNLTIIPDRRRSVTTSRCCSFCRNPGHTISFCNDERLQQFENLCNIQKATFVDDFKGFERWLMDYYLANASVTRAYAISKCGSTTRTRGHEHIESIMVHFYGEHYDLPDLVSDDEVGFDNFAEEINMSLVEYDLFRAALIVRANRSFGISLPLLIDSIYNNFVDVNVERERKFTIAREIKPNNTSKIEEQEKEKEKEKVCECNICYDIQESTNFVKLNCEHEFCKECLKNTLKTCSSYQQPNCAYCRTNINVLTYQNESVKSEFDEFIV